MTQEQIKFWDNVNRWLLTEYLRKKREYKLRKQQMYN